MEKKPDDVDVTDHVGSRVVFEDERLRIWEMTLAPGEQTSAHEHKLDYVVIILEGDRVAALPHPRSQGASASYIEVDVKPGDFFVMDRGGIETARNIGANVYRELLIELKDR